MENALAASATRTRTHHVANRAQHLAQISVAAKPRLRSTRQKRRYHQPFLIRQVARVTLRLALNFGQPLSALTGSLTRIESTRARPRNSFQTDSKIHALSDCKGRPLVLALTPGQAAEIKMPPVMLNAVPTASELPADKAYDSDWLCEDLANQGTRAVIPNKADRKYLHLFDKKRYKKRNAIECMFCHLKYFRCIATRYDK